MDAIVLEEGESLNMSSVNLLIKIGYDYLAAEGDKKSELERDLDAELRKQGLFSKKAEVLQRIVAEFGLDK